MKPEPPAIDCAERAPSEPLPRKPDNRQWERWAAYSGRLLGLITIERTQRAETADCLDRARAQGLIR